MNRFTLASSLLVLLEILQDTSAGFVDSVSGEIQGGNFTYFHLEHPGLIRLELISHTGDCDIYMSQNDNKPSFDPSSYSLQSSSCGVDAIIVPKRYVRPLVIGVYGHPSHESSAYTLNIYDIDLRTDADDELDELYAATKYGSNYGVFGRSVEQDHGGYHLLSFIMTILVYVYDCLLNLLKFLTVRHSSSNYLLELLEIFL